MSAVVGPVYVQVPLETYVKNTLSGSTKTNSNRAIELKKIPVADILVIGHVTRLLFYSGSRDEKLGGCPAFGSRPPKSSKRSSESQTNAHH